MCHKLVTSQYKVSHQDADDTEFPDPGHSLESDTCIQSTD